MSLPWEQGGLSPPADTPSQASLDEGEASLEDIPPQHLPCHCCFWRWQCQPLNGLNGAPNQCQQGPQWYTEYQRVNQSQKVEGHLGPGCDALPEWISSSHHSQRGQSCPLLDGPRHPDSLVPVNLEAWMGYLVAVREAKTMRGHLLQEAKSTCSKAICEAKAQKNSQAALLHKEHGNFMWDLEEEAMGKESRSHNDFIFACQVVLFSSPPLLKSSLAALYHLLLGQTPPSPPLIMPQRTSPVEEQPTTMVSPTLAPIWSPRPKRQHLLPDPQESMPIGGATPKAT